MAYDFPVYYRSLFGTGTQGVTSGDPYTLPGNNPNGPPKDETGALVPIYGTQAVYAQVYVLLDANYGPVTNDNSGSLSITFKDSAGASIGALSADWTLIGTGTAPGGSLDFTFSPSATPGPKIVERVGNGTQSKDSGGAVGSCFQAATTGVGLYDAYIITPTYGVNLPMGATATGTLTINNAAFSSSPSSLRVILAHSPSSAPALSPEGVLTATKVRAAGGNLWNTTTDFRLYTATAWDAYWHDGITWQHLSAAGGDTATFATSLFDIGVNRAYVRVTNSDGFTGWVTVANTNAAKAVIGVVLMPDGARILASESGGNVVIRRFAKGSSTSTTLATLTGLTRPRISTRNGVFTLLARVTSTGKFETRQSKNGGTTWP